MAAGRRRYQQCMHRVEAFSMTPLGQHHGSNLAMRITCTARTSPPPRSGTTTTRLGMTRQQRLRRASGFLADPWRPVRRSVQTFDREEGRAPEAGSEAGQTVLELNVPGSNDQKQDSRDPHRDPGPVLQRRRVALLPGQPGVLRRGAAERMLRSQTSSPDSLRHRPHLEPGGLLQRHGGERCEPGPSWKWPRLSTASGS